MKIKWVSDLSNGINHVKVEPDGVTVPGSRQELIICGHRIVLMGNEPDPLKPVCGNCLNKLAEVMRNLLIKDMNIRKQAVVSKLQTVILKGKQ